MNFVIFSGLDATDSKNQKNAFLNAYEKKNCILEN